MPNIFSSNDSGLLLSSLNSMTNGIILLDNEHKVIFWNQWVTEHTYIGFDDAKNKTLAECFANIKYIRLQQAISCATDKGQTSLLSSTLHSDLFPLWNKQQNPPEKVMQATTIKPLNGKAGRRYCMIQIIDVTPLKKRENLLRTQSKELKTVSEALHQQNKQHLAIIEHMADALIIMSPDYIIQDANASAERLFGTPDTDLINHNLEQFIQFFSTQDIERLHHHQRIKAIGLKPDEASFPLEIELTSLNENNIIIAIVHDLTDRQQYEDAISREKEFAHVTLHTISDTVITSDELGKINFINHAGEDLTEYKADDVLGKPILSVLRFRKSERLIQADEVLRKVLKEGYHGTLIENASLISRYGNSAAVDTEISPLTDNQGHVIGCVLVMQNVSEQRSLTEQLTYQATHDSLTGLLNRNEFEKQLESTLRNTIVNKTSSIICYLDLDQFKIINDTCGHEAGDQLLRQLSSLFRTKVRDTDILARLGGDEFAILFTGCSLERGQLLANNLIEHIRDYRFQWNDKTFTVGGSIGLLQLNENWKSVSDILSAVDTACYLAKDAGRNRVVTYIMDDNVMQQHKTELHTATSIQQALDENRFELYCQPIVPVAENADYGVHCEILLRMKDTDGKPISPMAFIPAAERYNLMHLIDKWVVEASLQFWDARPALVDQLEKCAINLSGQSLTDPVFLANLVQRLKEMHFSPSKICFEITETAAVANLDLANQFIRTLKNIGVKFALDDFGSGLSSFGYLKSLPVDYLKIDGLFVKDIVDDPIDAAMVEAISNVGKVMNLETIAEFVENDRILAHLRAIGVDFAQGYGISRPFPLLELENYIEATTNKT